MSKYTTEVRYICEKAAGMNESVGYSGVDKVLDDSWDKVFDFDFPIFDEDYRSVLCKKILKHYYTREIGFETVGLWKLKLNMMMNEIMPYYNQLYESTKMQFDPFTDADYFRDHKGKDAGSGQESGSHTGTVGDSGGKTGSASEAMNDLLSETSWDVYSDTPQGALTNVDENTYLTNARKVNHDSEDNRTDNRNYTEQNANTRTYNEATGNSRSFSNTDEYLDHVYGKMPGKSYMQLVKELRDNFLNIDVDIIGDLSDLFMRLW